MAHKPWSPELQKELRKKCKELQAEHMRAWEYLHKLVGEVKMPGRDLIFFKYPIKSPSLEVHDNIYAIIESVIEHTAKTTEQ